MAMVKVVSPSGWDFGVPSAYRVKVSSAGLVGSDFKDFVKRAGDEAAHAFRSRLGEVDLKPGDEPVHLISHGASDYWGANRNGDGFKEAACKRYMETFEKFARFYRNHKNKDPAESYGFPKLAAYNDRMRRAELLTILNGTKEAAARNGGHVADRELEKLARDGDLPVSMACRVPFDVCSWCQKKAATREEYCTESTCGAGGCSDNLAKVVKVAGDVHHLHVDNTDPCWFDMSHVFRPADRTAYGHRADYLDKAAADGGVFARGDASDLGVAPPLGVVLFQADLPVWTPGLGDRVKLAVALDKAARFMPCNADAARAFTGGVQPAADFSRFGPALLEKLGAVMTALADRKVVLPLRDFAAMTGRARLAKAAADRVPGAATRMAADGTLEPRMAKCAYVPAEGPVPVAVRAAADSLARTHSLEKQAVWDRVVISALRGDAAPSIVSGNKAAADGAVVSGNKAEAEDLARDYCCYKAAALRHIAASDDDFVLTARFAATQNLVS